MVLGFKIADGYVEVHANYDKNALQRAAQQAADDAGQTYSKEFGRSVARENRTTVPAMVDSFTRENTRRRGMWNRAGRSIASHIRDGLIGPGGAGAAARGFVRNFVEAITFGQADFQRVNTTGLARGFSVLGTTLGAGLAVALLAEVGNLITAGLPLLLGGAFAAIPFFTLIRSGMEKKEGKWHTLNNEMGRALDKIVAKWKEFKTEINKPWKATVFNTLKGLRILMDDLILPLQRIGTALAPSFQRLMFGVFDAIEAFVKALEPAMPGIVAGLNEWAKQLPRIATAIGDMIAYILKDPEQVSRSVKDFADFFILVTKIAGPVISFLTDLAHWLSEIARWGGSALHVGANFAIALQKGFQNVKPVIDKVIGWFAEMPGKIAKIVTGMLRALEIFPGSAKVMWKIWIEVITKLTEEFVDGVVALSRTLYTRVLPWVRKMWTEISNSFTSSATRVGTTVRQFVDRIVAFFLNLRTRIVDLVTRMWTSVRSIFTTSATAVGNTVRQFVDRLVAFFLSLRARIVDFVSRMWSSVRSIFTTSAAAAGNTVRQFVDRAVALFVNLRSRVVATANAMMNTVRSGISSGLNAVRNAFNSAVNAIRVIWDKLRAIARTPVAFVVNTVLNNGLLRAVRAISNFVGYGPGKNIRVAMASGGVLPGYTPGKDVHRFVSATGGVLDLSGGEGIARPELVKRIGTERWNAANEAARIGDVDKGVKYLGGFAQGGTLSGIASAENYARSIGIRSIGTYAGHHPSAALARDFMTSDKARGDRMAEWLWQNRRSIHLWYEIWYRRIRSMTREGAGWTPYTRSNPHTDHVHGSWYPAGLGGAGPLSAVSGIASSLDPGKYLNMVTGALGKLSSIKGTPWGQMVAGAATTIAGAVKDKITALARSFVGASAGSAFTQVTGGSNRAIGQKMMLQRWPMSQWNPLNSLWTKESGWNERALNRSSGAYGIPQSLPGSKMASAGADWRTNPATQIKWGLGYIASRYGSPASAWAHSQRTNWYDQGGVLPPGLSLAYNGTGRNEHLAVLPNAALQHASATGQSHGRAFSPTINVTVQAGLNPVDAGARRALVRALWLELDRYEKDYVR